MKSKLITIFVFFLNFFFSSIAFSVENKILFKINNEIISTIDVYNETKYLKLINPKLQNLDKENIYEIAKNSLIRENIKKIELLKNNIDLNIDDKVKNEIKSNFSKRLKFKNIKDFMGKPLIYYAIKSALKSNFISEVIVSTDCMKTKKISEKFGAKVPYLRDRKLSSDNATTIQLIQDLYVKYISKKKKLKKL